MKILIIGSSGFIASYLIAALECVERYQLVLASRTELQHVSGNSQVELLDIRDAAKVDYCVDLYQPDVIVHCAALANVDYCEANKDEAWQINVDGTRNLLKAAERVGAYFIFLSSDFVFDGTKAVYHEEDDLNPVSFYGLTKQHAEQYVRESSCRSIIVRPVLVYAWSDVGMRDNLFSFVLRKLNANENMRLVEDQIRTVTYVNDLVWVLTKLIEEQYEGILHVSGQEALSVYQFGLHVARHFNLNACLLSPVASHEFAGATLRPPRTVFDNRIARRELNFNPASIDRALQEIKDRLTC